MRLQRLLPAALTALWLLLTAFLPGSAWAEDKLIAIQADDGHWLGRCQGCQRVPGNVNNNSVMAHVTSNGAPNGAFARFTLQDAGNGLVALRSDNGSYVARCNSCVIGGAVPDFLFSHVTGYTDPKALPAFAKFRLSQLPNGKYNLQADTGKYVARCNSCSPGASAPDQIAIHANGTDPWAQWRIIDLNSAQPRDWVRLENRYLTNTFITVNPPTGGTTEGAQVATVSAIKVPAGSAANDNTIFERITMGPWTEYDPRATGVSYAFRSKAYPNIYLYTPPRDPDVPNAPETDPQDPSTYVGRNAEKPLGGQYLSSSKPSVNNRFQLVQALDATRNRQPIDNCWALESLARAPTKVGDTLFALRIPNPSSQEVLVTRKPFDFGEGGLPRLQIQADSHWFIRSVQVPTPAGPPGFQTSSP